MNSTGSQTAVRGARVIAFIVYIALALLIRFLSAPTGPYLSAWPVWEKVIVVFGIPLVPFAVIYLWGYAFAKNLGIVPRTAWIIAFACYSGFVILIHFLIPLNTEPGYIGAWPIAGQLAFTFLIPAVFFVFVPLYGYIYADAKRRGMRYVMWTLLAIFVPDLIGVILYFILRDALPPECATCHTLVLARYAFCPSCGTAMKPVCPQCGKALERSWRNCAYCGTKVPTHTQTSAFRA